MLMSSRGFEWQRCRLTDVDLVLRDDKSGVAVSGPGYPLALALTTGLSQRL